MKKASSQIKIDPKRIKDSLEDHGLVNPGQIQVREMDKMHQINET